jgi:hypothetical protein
LVRKWAKEHQQELLTDWQCALELKPLHRMQELTMIKIIRAQYMRQKILRLYFSDNSYGDYDLQTLIDRQTELVIPLNDEQYFKQFF